MSLVNAWDGCLEQAESGYNLLLTLNPRDAEARAGLIDILTWQGRWDEVLANLEAGVRLNPRNPTLLMRQAKLLYWSGDVTAATDILRQARQQGARGEEVENLRRRLYSDQLRTMMRIDKFPAGYPQVYSWGMQELHRMHRWELSLGTTLFRHSGGGVDSMVDGRHVAGVAYYPGIASSVGLNLGFGSPARYVPTFETKAWALFPLGHLFSGYFAYALWQYGTHKSVHMFAPAVGYTVIDGINIELRWWTSYVVLHAPALAVELGAHGARALGRALRSRADGARAGGGCQLHLWHATRRKPDHCPAIPAALTRRDPLQRLGTRPAHGAATDRGCRAPAI